MTGGRHARRRRSDDRRPAAPDRVRGLRSIAAVERASATGAARAWLAAALAVVLAVGLLTSCGGSGKTSAKTTTTQPSLVSPKDGSATTTATTTTATTTAPSGTSTTIDSQATTTTTTTASTPTIAAPVDTLDPAFVRAIDHPFSAASPWNAVIATSPPDPRSSSLIAGAQLRLGVQQGTRLETLTTARRPITKPVFINTVKWTPPVLDADARNAVATTLLCRQPNLPPPLNLCGDGYLVPMLKIPPAIAPYPQYDGWLTVVDAAGGYGYDLWRARRGSAGSASMSYQYLRRWSLSGPGYLQPTAPSARGSGLPLFAGIITPEDIRSGVIPHALAISVPGPAAINYVQPASLTDGNGAVSSLPEGARLRLKSSVSLARLLHSLPGSTNRRASAVIFTALRKYGAIVVDRSAVPTLYAQLTTDWSAPLRNAQGIATGPDGRTPLAVGERNDVTFQTPLLRGGEVSGLRLSDFEVIRLPTELKDPPVSNGDTAAALPGVAPQALPGGTGATAPASGTAVPGTEGVTPTAVSVAGG
jgi:hypothetical protein